MSERASLSILQKIATVLLAVVSVVSCAPAFVASLRFVKALILLLPWDPQHLTESRYRDLALERGGTLVLGIALLVGMILIVESYAGARTWGRLWRRFGIVSAVQAGTLLLGYVVPMLWLGT